MESLSKAPLIEAIFRLYWGKPVQDPDMDDSFSVEFHDDEPEIAERFAKAIANEGFTLREQEKHISEYRLPYQPQASFRKEDELWPQYEIGLGILTVRQANDGYRWETFKTDILRGVQCVIDSYQLTLNEIVVGGIELQYVDGFPFDEGETSGEFLRKKLQLTFNPPPELLQHEGVADDFRTTHLSFEVDTHKPKGYMLIQLNEAEINGRIGMVMKTSIRSRKSNFEPYHDDVASWLEDSHHLQEHAFINLIEPSFKRTMT